MFCIVNNESGDYFVIPVDKQKAWETFIYEEYGEGEQPDWAEYIGGFPSLIKFDNWMKL